MEAFLVAPRPSAATKRYMTSLFAGPSFERMKDIAADEFFGDPFFYGDFQADADLHADDRRKELDGMTAWDMLEGANSSLELNNLLSGTGVDSAKVKPYWNHVRSTPEFRLNGGRYALNKGDYLRSMSYFRGASNPKLRYEESPRKRSEDIHIVLGSMGSGKTAFAWEHLAHPYEINKSVRNGKGCCSFYYEASNDFSLNDTIQQIKERIYSETDRNYDANTFEPVDMNLALVIDEAAHLKGKLDSMSALRDAVIDLKALVKGHVRLILTGNGYGFLVDNISSEVDVFKYDMKPWL